MNISAKTNSLRIRFALGFGLLFTVFLAIAFIFIYISFAKFRKDDFYARLKDRALSTYQLLVEVKQVDSSLLNLIEKTIPSTVSSRQKVTVFKDSIVIYSSNDSAQVSYDARLFSRIKARKELSMHIGQDEAFGVYMERDADHYYILAAGYDKYGIRKINFLKWAMIIVYIAGIIIGWTVTYFFVKRIIRPLEGLKTNLKNINYNNLDSRLPETGQGEEVDSLSVNFNQMLARLEQSFSFQKDFVHYASHELRTPLAAMVGITENSINSAMSIEQSREVLKQLLHQQQNLTNITNSLLLLSGDTIQVNGHEYPAIRLDELVFRSVEISKNLFPDALINVNLEGELSNEDFLLIRANAPLILMAFNNLLKNGIQYSPDRQVNIIIYISEKEKQVKFTNAGNDFTAEEKKKIFTPFYRAANSIRAKGHGLGLSLVKQISQLHNARISYSYEVGHNVFTVTFH